jgi:ribosomal-protein-alanine acetyltransferase
MTVVVRSLAGADADAAADVAAACFDRPWSADVVRDEIGRPDRRYLGAFADGRLVAYAGTADLAGELHVMTVAVAPGHRRRGIARILVTTLLDHAKDAGHDTATLEVRATDPAARSLYASLGFEPVGERPGYYGADAAVIMTRSGL